MVVLNVNDIDWIEAAGNYSQLWVGSRSYLVRESLSVMAKRLSKNLFLRAHRRALVKIDNIRELTRDKSGGLLAVLSSGARIPISRVGALLMDSDGKCAASKGSLLFSTEAG